MAEIELGGMTFVGQSAAGVGTSLVLKEMKLCFDLGVLLPEVLSARNVFISHAHTDHAGELMNYLAIRALEHRDMATLFLPPEMGRQLPGILSAWQEMSGSKFEYRLIVLHPGAPAPLKNNVAVTPFLLAHEPQTVGFLVEQKVRKLREQFLQLPAEEIVQRKGAEADLLFQDEVRPLFAYVPDTLPEGLDALPEAAWRARVLALECSFLDARKPLEKIRIGRHLHVDDIAQRLPKFSGEHLLLFHFSKLYSPDEVRTLVDARFGDPWRGRVHCLLDAPTS